ncbi:MAG: hypothetical protein WKG07_42865 [Hymenobacter sp.]
MQAVIFGNKFVFFGLIIAELALVGFLRPAFSSGAAGRCKPPSSATPPLMGSR